MDVPVSKFPQYRYFDPLSQLERKFKTLLQDIEQLYFEVPEKSERIRVEQWVKKLCEYCHCDIWRRSRNEYAAMLRGEQVMTSAQLRDLGSLSQPFSHRPPEGPLPPVSTETRVINQLKPRYSSSKKSRANSSFSRRDMSSVKSIRDSEESKSSVATPFKEIQNIGRIEGTPDQKSPSFYQRVGMLKTIFNHYDERNPLDRKFISVMEKVHQEYANLYETVERIRVEAWTKKLCEYCFNDSWRRIRNEYASYLLKCVSNNRLSLFSNLPPEGPLNRLQLFEKVRRKDNRRQKQTSSASIE